MSDDDKNINSDPNIDGSSTDKKSVPPIVEPTPPSEIDPNEVLGEPTTNYAGVDAMIKIQLSQHAKGKIINEIYPLLGVKTDQEFGAVILSNLDIVEKAINGKLITPAARATQVKAIQKESKPDWLQEIIQYLPYVIFLFMIFAVFKLSSSNPKPKKKQVAPPPPPPKKQEQQEAKPPEIEPKKIESSVSTKTETDDRTIRTESQQETVQQTTYQQPVMASPQENSAPEIIIEDQDKQTDLPQNQMELDETPKITGFRFKR